MDEQVMDVKEAAEFLRMSVQHIYRLKAEGKIPCHKVGTGQQGKVLFLKGELLEWVRRQDAKLA